MNPSSGTNISQLTQITSAFQRWSLGRRVAIVAAVVGLLSTFLPWYGVSVSDPPFSYSASINGWHSWGYVAILGLILAGALSLPFSTGTTLHRLIPSLPASVTHARLLMLSGAVAALGAILFILTEGSGDSVSGVSQGASFGAYLGLLCALACVVGGFLLDKEPAQAG
jgi:hypothetical protein